MIPDYFAPTLELLSSGDLEQIRRGLRQAKELGADIPGVVSALEKLFAIETNGGDGLLDNLTWELFGPKGPPVRAGLEEDEGSGVMFLWGAGDEPIALEEALREIPSLTRHLPWTPQMQSSFVLYTMRAFQYSEGFNNTNASNLTHHEGQITLDAITSPQVVFCKFPSVTDSLTLLLHDHVKGFESLISMLQESFYGEDSRAVGPLPVDSSPNSNGIEDVGKIGELLPGFEYVLEFEAECYGGVPFDEEGNFYLDEDGEEITEEGDHPEIYYWGILARV